MADIAPATAAPIDAAAAAPSSIPVGLPIQMPGRFKGDWTVSGVDPYGNVVLTKPGSTGVDTMAITPEILEMVRAWTPNVKAKRKPIRPKVAQGRIAGPSGFADVKAFDAHKKQYLVEVRDYAGNTVTKWVPEAEALALKDDPTRALSTPTEAREPEPKAAKVAKKQLAAAAPAVAAASVPAANAAEEEDGKERKRRRKPKNEDEDEDTDTDTEKDNEDEEDAEEDEEEIDAEETALTEQVDRKLAESETIQKSVPPSEQELVRQIPSPVPQVTVTTQEQAPKPETPSVAEPDSAGIEAVEKEPRQKASMQQPPKYERVQLWDTDGMRAFKKPELITYGSQINAVQEVLTNKERFDETVAQLERQRIELKNNPLQRSDAEEVENALALLHNPIQITKLIEENLNLQDTNGADTAVKDPQSKTALENLLRETTDIRKEQEERETKESLERDVRAQKEFTLRIQQEKQQRRDDVLTRLEQGNAFLENERKRLLPLAQAQITEEAALEALKNTKSETGEITTADGGLIMRAGTWTPEQEAALQALQAELAPAIRQREEATNQLHRIDRELDYTKHQIDIESASESPRFLEIVADGTERFIAEIKATQKSSALATTGGIAGTLAGTVTSAISGAVSGTVRATAAVPTAPTGEISVSATVSTPPPPPDTVSATLTLMRDQQVARQSGMKPALQGTGGVTIPTTRAASYSPSERITATGTATESRGNLRTRAIAVLPVLQSRLKEFAQTQRGIQQQISLSRQPGGDATQTEALEQQLATSLEDSRALEKDVLVVQQVIAAPSDLSDTETKNATNILDRLPDVPPPSDTPSVSTPGAIAFPAPAPRLRTGIPLSPIRNVPKLARGAGVFKSRLGGAMLAGVGTSANAVGNAMDLAQAQQGDRMGEMKDTYSEQMNTEGSTGSGVIKTIPQTYGAVSEEGASETKRQQQMKETQAQFSGGPAIPEGPTAGDQSIFTEVESLRAPQEQSVEELDAWRGAQFAASRQIAYRQQEQDNTAAIAAGAAGATAAAAGARNPAEESARLSFRATRFGMLVEPTLGAFFLFPLVGVGLMFYKLFGSPPRIYQTALWEDMVALFILALDGLIIIATLYLLFAVVEGASHITRLVH